MNCPEHQIMSHHFARLLRSNPLFNRDDYFTPYYAPWSRAGYDPLHTSGIQSYLYEIEKLPKNTLVKFVNHEDEICKSCPLNIRGVRYNKRFADSSPQGPCDPRGERIEKTNQSELQLLLQIQRSRLNEMALEASRTFPEYITALSLLESHPFFTLGLIAGF